MPQPVVRTRVFGGRGGFRNFPGQNVRSIGLQWGKEKNRHQLGTIHLNGKEYGGKEPRDIIELANDEYIDEFIVREGNEIDFFLCKTNKGNSVKGGSHDTGGQKRTHEKNVRVLAIGGKTGSRVDMLRIKYIDNYRESRTEAGRMLLVIGIIAQGEEEEIVINQSIRDLQATRRVSETQFTSETSTSAEFIAMATVSASQRFGFSATTVSEYVNEVEKLEEKTVTSKRSPPEGFVGLEVTNADVFRSVLTNGKKGDYWFFPSGAAEYIEVPADKGITGQDCVDMTGVLRAQIPAMAARKKDKYGSTFDFYSAE